MTEIPDSAVREDGQSAQPSSAFLRFLPVGTAVTGAIVGAVLGMLVNQELLGGDALVPAMLVMAVVLGVSLCVAGIYQAKRLKAQSDRASGSASSQSSDTLHKGL